MHVESAPDVFEGWLEKKTASKMLGLGGEWEKLYAAVDEEAGSLLFYTSPTKTRSNVKYSIDLRLITDVSKYVDKKGSDSTRFNVTADDREFKFNTDSLDERERWMKGLHDWRDHVLMQVGEHNV